MESNNGIALSFIPGAPHSVGPSTSPTALGLLLRHSARSRGIQQPLAQSVLQAFLDAATARSMTGVCAQHHRGSEQHDRGHAA